MLLCILISCTVAFGQSATTSLRGVVKDPSGALVPGAAVTITDKATDKSLSATSGSTGLYQFVQIPPAHYTITVSANGFGSQSKTAELLVNQPATIDFTLSMQANSVTVDVSASAQTLNTTDASMGNSVGNETIQALPMDGRDPVSLLSLQPGVLFLGTQDRTGSTTDSRQGAVSGSRSDQGNVTLDGIDDNDQINGYAFFGVLRSTLDSTEEFRVTTSNGTAEAGRSSGAQVALITKAGTNKFHGSLYEYNRPSNLVANNWFLKQAQLSAGEKNRPTKYILNTFGGSIGGPVLKDKLFFFFNYEGQRHATNDAVPNVFTPSSTFLAGQVGYFYKDKSGNLAPQLLSSDQIRELDKNCTRCTTPGVNQAMQQYLSTEPAAQNLAAGDGINYGSYNFSSPSKGTENTSIAKLDYDLNAKNHIFARGNLQKDISAGDANLPGQPSASTTIDNTKGMAFGHTWVITNTITNDLRYAYVRQGYGTSGIGEGDYVTVRFLQQPTAQTRTTIASVPLHNIVDTASWTKGNHSFTAGGNWRRVTTNNGSDNSSFSGASTNPSWLNTKSNTPDPTTLGLPAIDPSSLTAFYQMYSTIIGNVPELDSNPNYKVTSPTSASLLKDGAFIDRQFRANEFEYYLQDSWRARPNLTITLGLRHTLLQTPYETHGQEIAPTVDTRNWFLERGIQASKGQVLQPDLFFAPAGKFYNKPAFWPKQKANFAPRLAIVFSPDTKTSIRAGAGFYFDHYGEALAHRFSTLGSFGLASQLQSPPSYADFETSPRFTGPHDLPNLPIAPAPPTQAYPYAVPDGSFGINWGIDNHVKTPYVEAFNLSVQRELPSGFLLEVAYVGRLGRHLMQQLDLAEPVNFNDPQGAGDYYSNAAQLSAFADAHNGDPCAEIPKNQYFEDVFGFMAQNLLASTATACPNIGPAPSATQVAYTQEFAPTRYSIGETQALLDMDFGCGYNNCPSQARFWDAQFSSLISIATVGTSYYNAAQLTLRHPTKHGLTTDVSYTLSKSIDMGSDAERSATSYGAIQNSWNPALSRGVSDFDTRHLITVDWAYAVPVGRGRTFLPNAGTAVDALLGGWQWAGVGRWTSGLPFSLIEPGWSTNWELQAWAVPTTKVKIHKHIASGVPQVFADVNAIQSGYVSGSPIRLPYPGEAGPRNNFRGDGVLDITSSLTKSWNLHEIAKLKFAWEVYNVSNSIRFDTNSINTAISYGGLGAYTSALSKFPFRRMQFGLRLDF